MICRPLGPSSCNLKWAKWQERLSSDKNRISKSGMCYSASVYYACYDRRHHGSVNRMPLIGSDKKNTFGLPIPVRRLHQDLPQVRVSLDLMYKTLGLFLRPGTRNNLVTDVSCKISFLYASIFFKLCWSFSSICFQQHRTRRWVELWIVPRKRNWRSSRIPWNAVCCPTVCITQILLVFTSLIDVLLFLKSVRFAPAEPPLKFSGVRQATSFGAACIQQAVTIPPIPGGGSTTSSTSVNVTSEDCMNYHLKLRLWHILTNVPLEAFLSTSLNQPVFLQERNFQYFW